MYTETRKNETNRSEYRSGNSFPLSASQILEYIIEIQLFPIPNDLYLSRPRSAFVNIPSKWCVELCFR